MADYFMTKPITTPPTLECTRRNRILCRYDTQTGEYGTMYVGGWLITYFLPTPGADLTKRPPRTMHRYRTNVGYSTQDADRKVKM